MNREDIIRMAREADLGFLLNENWLMHEELERFAALVASAEREKYEAIITNMTKLLEAQQNREGVAVDMIAAGIAAEREACAKVCEQSQIPIPIDVWHGGTKKEMTKHTALALANAIRARGQA